MSSVPLIAFIRTIVGLFHDLNVNCDFFPFFSHFSFRLLRFVIKEKSLTFKFFLLERENKCATSWHEFNSISRKSRGLFPQHYYLHLFTSFKREQGEEQVEKKKPTGESMQKTWPQEINDKIIIKWKESIKQKNNP